MTIDVATLQADLIQAEGALRATASVPLSPTSFGSTDSLTFFHFGNKIAKHLAMLAAAAERDRTPSKNSNNFGYDKISVLEYSGNIQEYTKWRSQVEDYLKQTAKQST